jgi:hypothetical protein
MLVKYLGQGWEPTIAGLQFEAPALRAITKLTVASTLAHYNIKTTAAKSIIVQGSGLKLSTLR